MAVPKKRTSKSKKKTRQFVWTEKPMKEALKSISLAKCFDENNKFEDKLSKDIFAYGKKPADADAETDVKS